MRKILSLIALREKEKETWETETVGENEKARESECVEAGGLLISKSDIFPLE